MSTNSVIGDDQADTGEPSGRSSKPGALHPLATDDPRFGAPTEVTPPLSDPQLELLPTHEMTWPGFERLLLRLAREVVVTMHVWDEAGQSIGVPLTGHTGFVSTVALGLLGGRDVIISAGGPGGTLRIWDEAGQPVGQPFTGHTGLVAAVALGRLGGRDVIVSASVDKTVRV